MLKIKDNVDLKELEKFGFTKYEDIMCLDIKNENSYIRIREDRKVIFGEVCYEDMYLKVPNILFDLFQAGLVEKIEE